MTAPANAAGGVMGKMISLQSIAVAVAATGMAPAEEAKLFRYTLRHSMVLMELIGVITLVYHSERPNQVLCQFAHAGVSRGS